MRTFLLVSISIGFGIFNTKEAVGLKIWPAATEGEKTCVPLGRQSLLLPKLKHNAKAKISPDGRWLLYEEGKAEDDKDQTTTLILLDLNTEKKIEFLPPDDLIKIYGFSSESSLAWVRSEKEGHFKVRDLSFGEERIIPIEDDHFILKAGLAESGETITLWSLGPDQSQGVSFVDLHSDIYHRLQTGQDGNFPKELFEMEDNTDVIVHLVDLTTFSKHKRVFDKGFMTGCYFLNGENEDSGLSLFQILKDGSLYKTSLISEDDPVELFGPVEGFEISEDDLGSTGIMVKTFTQTKCAFSTDGRLGLLKMPEGRYLLRVLEEGKEFYLPNSQFAQVYYNPPGEADSFVLPKIMDLNSLIEQFIRYPFIVTPRGIDTWHVRHLPTNTKQMATNTRLLHSDKNGLFAFIDWQQGEKQSFQGLLHPFDPDKQKTLFSTEAPVEICAAMDGDNRDKTALLATVWGDLLFIDIETGTMRHHLSEGKCALSIPQISENTALFQNPDGSHTVHRFQERCFKPLSDSPDLQQALSQVAEAHDPREHSSLSSLVAAFRADAIKSHPELARKALLNILNHSPVLFLYLYRRFPDLNQLPPSSVDQITNSEKKEKLKTAAYSLLKFATTEYQWSRLSDWRFLTLLYPFLDLSKQEKHLYIEKITVSITNGATRVIPLFEDVFQSKLYYIVQGHVKELFGLQREPVSDLTIVRKETTEWSLPTRLTLRSDGRNPNHLLSVIQQFDEARKKKTDQISAVIPVILASDPIEGIKSYVTDFGIHFAVVEKAIRPIFKHTKQGSELLKDSVEWSLLNGKSYRADLLVHAKYIRNNFFINFKGPSYDSVWGDHKMVGAIIVGSSLYGFSRTLLEEYLAYFQEQGFQFVKSKTSDLKTFLLEGIKSCEIDYFLKESHSDGDERNIFRFNRMNYIAQGVRYGDQGRIEVVYIIFPPPLRLSGLKTELLSNKELGEAIAEREKKSCGQLTYFNTSCWSHVKARYEIEAVNSPLFLNIPSVRLSDTFLNEEGEAIRSLLHSYRNGLDFDGFRKALETNEGYKSLKSNLYIFPDSSIYHKTIFNLISVPLDIQIKLERKEGNTWQPLDPDEAL